MSTTMLSGHTLPTVVSQRLGTDAVSDLTNRFAAYLSRVRQMRELSVNMENINFVNSTKILEDEIITLKSIYEKQLEELRSQLEETGKERTAHQLMAAKNGAQLAEINERLAEEINIRKKTENELAAAYRIIAEKEAQLQEARVTTTQQMNSHEDTKRDRDNVACSLVKTQHDLEKECAARDNVETIIQQLRDKLKFDWEVHQKELQDFRYRLGEAETALLFAEERLREHNIVDENLSAMLAQIKLHSDEQLRRYKQESESSYQSHMTQMQTQLDGESRNLSDAIDENIKLRASVEQMNTKCISLESKCQSIDDQNRSLIQDLEIERQQATNTIKNLEAKLREFQQALMVKIRELGLAYSAHTPTELELNSLATLLEAEEKRLQLSFPTKVHLNTKVWSSSLPCSRSTNTGLTRASTSLPNFHTDKETKVKQKVRPKTTPGNFSANSGQVPNSRPITTSTPLSSSMSYIPNFVNYCSPTSSHTGQVKILEVNPSGKYVRLFNSSSFQDQDIGGFMIQQNIAGRPVTVFRFPPRTKLKASAHVTVWSASSLAQHNPPSDLLWKDQHKWGTGPECTTILCKPNGQAVAWTTSAFPFGIPKVVTSRSDENLAYNDRENTVQQRVKTGENDGMIWNAQSRSQTTCPDSKKGGLKTEKNKGNEFAATKGGTNGKNGGTIRVRSPSHRFGVGLAKLNSQQRVSFQPSYMT